MNDFKYSMACFHIPEQKVSPPEIDDWDYDRNVRNACRKDAIQAIDTLVSNLDELDHDGKHRHTQKYLENLRDYLERDMEDYS
jgi:hypothetical protein